MKSLWKRAVSLLLTLSMLLPLFPVSVFADEGFDATVPIYSDHADEEDLSLELGENTLTPAILATDATSGILTEPYQKDPTGKIDLWPSSSNMVANNEDDGSVIPYVYDEAGNRWYLKEIGWSDRTALNGRQTGTIMDADAIKAAAQAKDKTCYEIDPATKINVPPKGITYGTGRNRVTVPAYIICYYWTTDAPESWGSTITSAETYSIQYNNGLPEELGSSFMLYRIKKDGTLDIGDSATSKAEFQKEFGALTSTVKDGLNFIVAKNADYKGYLAFIPEKDLYYEFVGWQVTSSPNNTIYKTGDILKPVNYQVDGEEVVAFALQEDDGLAETNDVPATVAEDGKITLTGVWSQIKLKNSFKGAPEFLLLAEDNNTAQIVQWTNDNEANATTKEILLDEDDTLYYRATVYMTDEVAGMLESKTMNNPAFAEFDITVNVDSNLVIDEDSIDAEGNVMADFVCPFLTPTAVVVDGTEIAGASFTSDASKENAHTITVPDSAITNNDGTLKSFTIHVQWIADKNHTYSTLKQPMTLTSFGLALKTGADGKVENTDFTLKTSGEVNGTIDFSLTNRRVLYQAASALLNSKGDWQEYFEGDGSSPTALVNASRYIQAIGENNAQLTANPVTAKYGEPAPETYTVTLKTNGGTIAEGKEVTQYTAGVGATLPMTEEEIFREGYTFQGWYADKEFSDEEPIRAIGADETGHKIYYAKWEKKQDEKSYSVFLIKNGGTFAEGKQLTQYTAGVETALPVAADITREGYNFAGWYADEELTDGPYTSIEDTATGCKVFFAKWEEEPHENVFSVLLVKNDGTIAEGKDVKQYTAGVRTSLPTADDITREGYIFRGWYVHEDYSDEEPVLYISENETGDKIYYAKWEEEPRENVFSVFLIKNGGAIAEGKDVTKYVAGEETLLPTDKDITREGYTFKGWYADEKLTDGPYASIADTAWGAKLYFAKWEPVPATPSEPAQSGSDDGMAALLGTGVVLVGGAATLAYLYRDALPIWLFTGVVKLDDEDGTPVPNATVTLYQDGEEVKSVTTNDDGSFKTRVPKGDYEVVVTWERDGVQYTTTTQATVDQVAGDVRPQEIILALEQLPDEMLP